MAQPDEQSKQNLLAALDGFAAAFEDRGFRFDPPTWEGHYWNCWFQLGQTAYQIRSDEKDVWLPLKLTTHTRYDLAADPLKCFGAFQATPAQFVQVMQILTLVE